MAELSDLERGILIGLLVGEGSFGGDGRQPQVTLRMHVRHERLFSWLTETFPGSRVYGPYNHGGREYYQWMARGPYLRETLLPLLVDVVTEDLDAYTAERLQKMAATYGLQLGGTGGGEPSPMEDPSPRW